MTTMLATTTLMLPELIGVSVKESRCLLNGDQIAQLFSFLFKIRPSADRYVCFIGGSLSRTIGVPPALHVIHVQRTFGDDPFLVIVSKGGAITLLTSASPESRGYRARLFTDLDIVDRAALALAHFSDAPETLDASTDHAAQRTFIQTILAELVADPFLNTIDLDELIPNERRRLAQARERVAMGAAAPTPTLAAPAPPVPTFAPPAPTFAPPAPTPTFAPPAPTPTFAPPTLPTAFAPPAVTPAFAPPPAVAPAPLPIPAPRALVPVTRSTPTDRRAPLATLLRHLADSVLLVDQDGRVAGFSPALEQLLNMSASAIGQPLGESPAANCMHMLTNLLLGEATGPETITLPSGRRATVSAINVDHGMWAMIFQAEELPVAVPPPASPAPMTSDDIMVERAERFMVSFANGMRAPLRALRDLISQLSAAGPLNEQQLRVIGQVAKLNGEIMLLVNDLFVLGQMRMQVPDSRVSLRIDLLIEAAVGTQYAEFGRRGQTVDLETQPNLPTILGSEEGLWRAFTALIDNAIKYCPTGAHIVVRSTYQLGEVQVAVHDNGPGMSAEELDQIFDPFYRAPLAEQVGVPGRGLGLTIARALIEQHGGRIWAESSVGGGSTFTVSLPTT